MKLKQHSLMLTLLYSLVLFGCGQSQQGDINNPSSGLAAQAATIDAIKKAAESGDAKAQLELAKLFDSGDKVEKNLATAFDWFLKAAENGNIDAMVEIATRFREGKGVQLDWEKSEPWWKKAAEIGNPEAQYTYAETFGSTRNAVIEVYGEKNKRQENAQQYLGWLEKAAKQNHAAAKYSLGMI